MRVLLVYCHPLPESFCAALRDRVRATLEVGGHELVLLDLYAEGFNPVMGPEERRSYEDGPPDDPQVMAHVGHLAWAEALIFVYPTWWYGLPAMLKGWLDRVWAPGVAFVLPRDGGRIRPLMTHIRHLGVITTCGASLWWSWVIGQPGRRTILRGIRALCAPRCSTFYLAHYRMDASTPASRAAFLERVGRRLGRL
jgi:putative NADPH-quinone reductase